MSRLEDGRNEQQATMLVLGPRWLHQLLNAVHADAPLPMPQQQFLLGIGQVLVETISHAVAV